MRAAEPLTIVLSPEAAHPGDVVRVDIPGARSFSTEVFGRESHSGLVGIDLDTKPGPYMLRVTTSDGQVVERTLQVLAKAFPIRRLRVAPAFVDPPPDEAERIAREYTALETIFRSESPRKWNGSFLLPVDGTATSNFGSRSYYNGRRRSPHAGVDFVGQPGTPIRAGNSGQVVLAEPLYFTGNTVIVDYGGGLYSLFAHMSEFRVSKGDSVAPDTIVGLVGATGRVTGPHLHWSVRLLGARVDPLSLVAATRVPYGGQTP
jgi:murein DD-endopeptidase MepM/ murein hydrolase activator NlpD